MDVFNNGSTSEDKLRRINTHYKDQDRYRCFKTPKIIVQIDAEFSLFPSSGVFSYSLCAFLCFFLAAAKDLTFQRAHLHLRLRLAYQQQYRYLDRTESIDVEDWILKLIQGFEYNRRTLFSFPFLIY